LAAGFRVFLAGCRCCWWPGRWPAVVLLLSLVPWHPGSWPLLLFWFAGPAAVADRCLVSVVLLAVAVVRSGAWWPRRLVAVCLIGRAAKRPHVCSVCLAAGRRLIPHIRSLNFCRRRCAVSGPGRRRCAAAFILLSRCCCRSGCRRFCCAVFLVLSWPALRLVSVLFSAAPGCCCWQAVVLAVLPVFRCAFSWFRLRLRLFALCYVCVTSSGCACFGPVLPCFCALLGL